MARVRKTNWMTRAGKVPRVRIRLRALALLSVFALGSIPCNATIILVTLTRDAIYVGADGRGTIIDEAGNETYTDICKIKQFGKVVMAYSGTVSDPTANFDVWDILSRINAGSVAEFADKVAKVLTDRFQATIEQKERSGKAKQNPFIPGDIGILSFEGGKPAYVRILGSEREFVEAQSESGFS